MGGYIDALDFTTGELFATDINTSKTTGGRFALGWMPNDKLEINLSALINSVEQGGFSLANEDFSLAGPSGGSGAVAPNGSRIPGVAEQSFNLSGQYNFQFSGRLGGFARLDYSYVGDSTDILVSPIIVDSYEIVNARIGVTVRVSF